MFIIYILCLYLFRFLIGLKGGSKKEWLKLKTFVFKHRPPLPPPPLPSLNDNHFHFKNTLKGLNTMFLDQKTPVFLASPPPLLIGKCHNFFSIFLIPPLLSNFQLISVVSKSVNKMLWVLCISCLFEET